MQNTKILQKNFMQAPCSTLRELNSLFFELNDKNAEKKRNTSYINKRNKDGLKIEKIKNALINSRNENLKEIYLIGGEPLYHPDFNLILRMCLKCANTTIITNGTSINEKKARFLRKIDNESNYETIFRINLSHWEEEKNDSARGYGNFRRVMSAITSLIRYEFNPIINFINIYNETRENALTGFREAFQRYNQTFEDINLKIYETINNTDVDIEKLKNDLDCDFDCSTSRTVSQKGVFACPSLCNDFRARVGADLSDYTKKIYLDTEKCMLCRLINNKIYLNDWI